MERLSELYQLWRGNSPANVVKLAGEGSNRVYYRLSGSDDSTVIGVVGTSRDENHAFISIARQLASKGLNVPMILAVSDDEMCYLQSDLGNVSLFAALKDGREKGGLYSAEEQALLVHTIRELPRLQVLGAEGMDFSVCYPQPEFDKQGVFFDLNYFKYCFLKATGVDFHECRLEEDFRSFADDLTSGKAMGFLYRDFQARNVMLDGEGNPWFIDFQGGRRGPFYYDVASFLWQASARYPDSLREMLIKEYYDSLSSLADVPAFDAFRERLRKFVLFRTMQVLGAYGFRGYFERKQHFIASIPPAIDNLRQLLKHDFPYPYLMSVLREIADLPRFQSTIAVDPSKQSVSKYDGSGPLVVRVFSFSYKKGIPADESGNGGGYVFDCRSTHNPGRYDEYKQLTGLDAPVIVFLENDGEILHFLESVYRLADHHVERYIKRGFTSLMFSFGCTGGRHRSVYSAQHLAEHIHEKYGVEVRICHREQGITSVLPRKED